MENFLLNYLYYGLIAMATVVVTAFIICIIILVVRLLINFFEDYT